MTQVPLPFPPHDAGASEHAAAPTDPGPSQAAETGARAVAAVLSRDQDDEARRDRRRASAPPAPLAPFVEAGVLAPADVHVAAALSRLLGDPGDEVMLGAALAVRAPRRQHVCVDLDAVRATVVAETAEERPRGHLGEDDHAGDDAADDPVAALPWPDPAAWRAALAASPLVVERDPRDLTEPADAGRDVPPLVLAGTRLYLDRYWRHERRTARALHDRAQREVEGVDLDRLRADLRAQQAADADRGPAPGAAPDRQQVAAVLAVTRHLTVIAGGPGTGKTTTVARILGLLDGQAAAVGARPPAVALAAPTGKAAARLTESLRAAAGPGDDRLRDATATTLHRLLGSLGGHGRRFRHGPGHPLPHDVVIVDETSMVDLTMLSRLLDAVRADARVVLLGDPHQLASVEAGSVLGDVVGDPSATPCRSATARATLQAVLGDAHLTDTTMADATGVHDALVVLDRVHRFAAGSGVDRFATAVREGDADAAVSALEASADLHWIRPGGDADSRRSWRRTGPSDAQLAGVRDRVLEVGRQLRDAARTGDGAAALAALDEVRVLCAHRRGEPGVAGWTARIEAWLTAERLIDPSERWYLGRPVMATTNDRRLQLWNGDLGVIVAGPGGPTDAATGSGDAGGAPGVTAAFPAPDGDGVRTLAPARIGDVETVHAMTVHKSQGSQVRHAVVVLPDPASRICTRELLYTAVTRARQGATIVATEAAIRTTISARTHRASGLGDALRDQPGAAHP
ncbi:exodeoxyribonuclease V subunit alpha [Nitriliruptor alkaliphilus]|uniref:exodeoxyribonuclease V subunit alpha n=1 Tax=Nitriliruptor alkaliphilus TaxID=427918 RepID=UPI0006965482|nr:exodeoxyribonuclease V subunit alpha [Nitriliruptor alkaliphilus]